MGFELELELELETELELQLTFLKRENEQRCIFSESYFSQTQTMERSSSIP